MKAWDIYSSYNASSNQFDIVACGEAKAVAACMEQGLGSLEACKTSLEDTLGRSSDSLSPKQIQLRQLWDTGLKPCYAQEAASIKENLARHVPRFDQLAERCASDADFANIAADVYSDAGRHADAERIVHTALEANSEEYYQGELLWRLGWVLIRQQRHQDAIDLGERTASEYPKDHHGYLILQEAYKALGNPDLAEAARLRGEESTHAFWTGAWFRYQPLPVVVLMAIAAISGIFFGLRFSRRGWRGRLIEDTPTSKVASAAQGYVELEGRAEPADGALRSPLSDTPCVWFHAYIMVTTGSAKNRKTTVRNRTTSESPVQLVDSTGSCLLDVKGMEVDASNVRTWSHTSSIEYHEELILAGDPIFALGNFESEGSSHKLVKPLFGRPFYMSGHTQRGRTRQYRFMFWCGNLLWLGALAFLPWMLTEHLQAYPPGFVEEVLQMAVEWARNQ